LATALSISCQATREVVVSNYGGPFTENNAINMIKWKDFDPVILLVKDVPFILVPGWMPIYIQVPSLCLGKGSFMDIS
jgi:hypothetical protein